MVSNKILTRLFVLLLLFSCLLSLHADVALSSKFFPFVSLTFTVLVLLICLAIFVFAVFVSGEIKSNNEKLEMELHEINQVPSLSFSPNLD